MTFECSSLDELAERSGYSAVTARAYKTLAKTSGLDVAAYEPGRPSHVSNEDFIVAWEEGGTETEIAKRFGMSYSAVQSRVKYLRGKGVPLSRRTPRKTGRRPTPKGKYKELASLAKSAQKENA